MSTTDTLVCPATRTPDGTNTYPSGPAGTRLCGQCATAVWVSDAVIREVDNGTLNPVCEQCQQPRGQRGPASGWTCRQQTQGSRPSTRSISVTA